jgi:hypothetical protein
MSFLDLKLESLNEQEGVDTGTICAVHTSMER